VHYEAMLHMLYLMLYLLGIWLFCLILSCTAITVERESRALPILLTAPVSDAQIIWAKTASVFRRVGPLGALMLAHLIVFTILPSIHPLGMLYMSLIALYSSVFIVCLGMYCSALTRTSTASIILALALLLAFWLALPMVVNVATDLAGPTLWEYGISQPAQFLGGHLPSTFNSFNALNPLVQMSVMITSTCGEEKARLHPNLLEYRWMASYGRPGNGAAGVIVGSLLLYASLSAWLLWRAKIRLRKNVFVG